ncbi:MAG: hypothetical protein LIP12_09345 [Clostridiales bacterium]|nr:hypothetical protein [Clostridiales bacterium]
MSKIKKVFSVLLAVTMLAGFTCTATVAFAEEAAETEAVTEAAADVAEDVETETESSFEWTDDMVLTFTDGNISYEIYYISGLECFYMEKYIDGVQVTDILGITGEGSEVYVEQLLEFASTFFSELPSIIWE